MITVKDINTKIFTQARPGYDTAEVDKFLEEIAGQMSSLLAEKEDSDKKIETLVDGIRRYKADEEALKDAMIGAQKQGRAVIADANEKAEQIIAEAQQKAEQIISEANLKADEIIGSTAVRAEREKASLEKMQAAVKDFKRELLSMYKEHLGLITRLPEIDDEEENVTEAEAVPEENSPTEETDGSEEDLTGSETAPETSDAALLNYDNMEQTRVIETPNKKESGLKLSFK